MEEKRPDPDILLEQVKREEIENSEIKGKGKLKIFLGYSAGVGKTFRMLQESQAAKNSNKSVCIAVVETHGRKETEAMLLGLEIIPRKKVEYSGIVLYEMDIDAVLIRRPLLFLLMNLLIQMLQVHVT